MATVFQEVFGLITKIFIHLVISVRLRPAVVQNLNSQINAQNSIAKQRDSFRKVNRRSDISPF